MFQVGVQTKGMVEGNAPEAGLERIAAAGFDCADLNLDVFFESGQVRCGCADQFFKQDMRELEAFFTPWARAAESLGLRFSQMHAPYPAFVWGRRETGAYMRESVIPKSLRIAGFLGIPYVVVHPGKLQYQAGKEEEARRNLDYFASLIPLAKECGVVVCMENLYEVVGGRLVEGPCSDPAEAARWLDCLNQTAGEERFGFCLDTGHLNLTKREPGKYIAALGSRIKALHLHDNNGREDLHQIPYTFSEGEGVDWEEVLAGLARAGYRGALSFETAPCLRSFPDQMRLSALRAVEGIGRYFEERMKEECRRNERTGNGADPAGDYRDRTDRGPVRRRA